MLKIDNDEWLDDITHIKDLSWNLIADEGEIHKKLATYSDYAVMKMIHKMKKSLNIRDWLIIALTLANIVLIGLQIWKG